MAGTCFSEVYDCRLEDTRNQGELSLVVKHKLLQTIMLLRLRQNMKTCMPDSGSRG